MTEVFKLALEEYVKYCKEHPKENRTTESIMHSLESQKEDNLNQMAVERHEKHLAFLKQVGFYDPNRVWLDKPTKKTVTILRKESQSKKMVMNPDKDGPNEFGFYSQAMRLYYSEFMVNKITSEIELENDAEKIKELQLLKFRFEREYRRRLHNKTAGDPDFYLNPLNGEEMEIPTNKIPSRSSQQLPVLPYFDIDPSSATFRKILDNKLTLTFYNGFIEECNGHWIWGELYKEEQMTTEEGYLYIPKQLGKTNTFQDIFNQLLAISGYTQEFIRKERTSESEFHDFITSPKKVMDEKPPKIARKDPEVFFYVNKGKNCVEFIYRRQGLDHVIGKMSLHNNNIQQILQDLLYQLYLGFFSKKAKK